MDHKKNIPTSSNNSSRGLFFSFDNRQPTPKQSVLVRTVAQPKPFYPKKGYALILNHYEYIDNIADRREGTQYDVYELEKVFAHYNIETNVKTDLKLNEIKKEIDILQTKNFTNYECFIIVIMTHGHGTEYIYAKDQLYDFEKVIEDPLLNKNATLLDKPKIFVIQACRGRNEMPIMQIDGGRIKSKAASKQNIFKCYSTYEGYVSYRDRNSGSIFIQVFCQKWMEMKNSTIYDVMKEVIDKVSKIVSFPQVPVVKSSMTKSFCLGSLLN